MSFIGAQTTATDTPAIAYSVTVNGVFRHGEIVHFGGRSVFVETLPTFDDTPTDRECSGIVFVAIGADGDNRYLAAAATIENALDVGIVVIEALGLDLDAMVIAVHRETFAATLASAPALA